MARLVYGDFDEFADNISGVAGRFVPTARSTGEWWIDKVRPVSIDVQQLQIGGATTFAGDGAVGSVSIGVALSDPALIRIDGQSLASNNLLLIRNSQPFTASSRQLTRWCGVTIPVETLHETALHGEVTRLTQPPAEGIRIQTDEALIDDVRAVIGRACADSDTVSIVDPVAANAMQEEVLRIVMRALEAGHQASDRHIGRPQVSRTRVIARCLELIDASDGQPLFIDDLCTATQVSERTLRNIFQEFFGVGPMRLLKVRQLREIRSALLRADPLTDTVTKIAARFGVWDFSLFARNYRALYAEAPSQTLRRRRNGVHHAHDDETLSPTWIGFAARRFVSSPAAHETAAPAAMPRAGN